MEHCYSYDFSKQSHGPKIKKQGCKLFKINVKDFINFKDFNIRSAIDTGSLEFDLRSEEFEKCQDIKTDKAWFKLMHLLYGFRGKYDVKKIILDDIKTHSRAILNYDLYVKDALSEYIELLRTGDYSCNYRHMMFYGKMSVEDLVDLLEKELLSRATIYQDPDSQRSVIVEITDYYYDYDALYKKYGITPEDNSSESYNNFIKYITTSEETERQKRLQAAHAEMLGE